MLLKSDGSLLAAACAPQEDNSAKIVAAIVANIWSTFEKGGELEYQIIDCEEGRLVVTKVSKLLLCIYGDTTVQVGMLKAKAQTLRNYLEEPLKQVLI